MLQCLTAWGMKGQKEESCRRQPAKLPLRKAVVPGRKVSREIAVCVCRGLVTRCLPLILLRFPSEGSKLPYDSIQKSCSSPAAGGKAGGGS